MSPLISSSVAASSIPYPGRRAARASKPGWRLVREYLAAGRTIIGIDEVGRGAWAGPVVAGAVIIAPKSRLAGLNDSKLVSAKRRSELDGIIRRRAVGFGLGWVSAGEVDEFGLSWAVAESGRRAIAELWTPDAVVILDGKWNYLKATHDSVAIVKADNLVVPVAAASIIAKVARDHHMAELATIYPDYGFDQHVGYGTKFHQTALQQFGPCVEHRCSYESIGAARVND